MAKNALPFHQQLSSKIDHTSNKPIGTFSHEIGCGENQILKSTSIESMSYSSSDDTFYVGSFQESQSAEVSSGTTRESISPAANRENIYTKNIPFPNNYIRRTESENQLMTDTAAAEMRDWQMLSLILSGVRRNKYTNQYNRRAAVENILRRHSVNHSEYVDHDAIAAMSIPSSQDPINSNASEQDWIIGDTFEDCIFEMDL